MRHCLGTIVLIAALVVPLVGGCSRTISEKETTRHETDGTKSVNRETVKERPDGTVVRETEKVRR